jgi:NADPH2:quinone reductase
MPSGRRSCSRRATLRGAAGTSAAMRALSAEALRRAAAGTLRPVIGQSFPLAAAAAAHAAIGSRATLCKTLLDARAAHTHGSRCRAL